jgi:hypothetical protein
LDTQGSQADVPMLFTLQVATRDSGTYRKMASVIEQLRARDARLIVMVNEGDPLLTSPGAKGCRFIEVRQLLLPTGPELPECKPGCLTY